MRHLNKSRRNLAQFVHRVLVPVSASFFAEGPADAPVRGCMVNDAAMATNID
jgi:hypothetical protein